MAEWRKLKLGELIQSNDMVGSTTDGEFNLDHCIPTIYDTKQNIKYDECLRACLLEYYRYERRLETDDRNLDDTL